MHTKPINADSKMIVTPITGRHMHEFRNLTSPQRVVGLTPTIPQRASIKSRRIRVDPFPIITLRSPFPITTYWTQ